MKSKYYIIISLIVSILFFSIIIFISINFGIVDKLTYENCTNVGTHYVCFPENYEPTFIDLLFIGIIILITILIFIIINKIYNKIKEVE